jgi:hypothetical protein
VLICLYRWLSAPHASHIIVDACVTEPLRALAAFARTSLVDAARSGAVSGVDEALAAVDGLLALLKPPPAAKGAVATPPVTPRAAALGASTPVSLVASTTITLATAAATAAAASASNVAALLCARCHLARGELKLATGKWTRPLCLTCAHSIRESLDLKMQFLPYVMPEGVRTV